ncbi:hypothetical protein A0H81_07793 [Grifola frondosa]|uniref:Uncharacterized protein n=1 Tax=Grifola frondosa TaxID=5627 RepID=A0A1C7M5K5_GRIFR|nr:hypothetical protein A0H81_07793 [Grifola frondosa]
MQINTLSSVVECEPVQFTWSGGASPYYLSLIPGGQPAAPAIKQFPVQNGNSYTWNVDLPAGTTFTTSLKDSTGSIAYSDIQTVQPGPNASSVTEGSIAAGTTMPPGNTAGVQGAAASTTGMNPVSSGSSQPSGSGTPRLAASSTITTETSSKNSSTGSAPSATTSANAASRSSSIGAFGVAGLMGIIGFAIL